MSNLNYKNLIAYLSHHAATQPSRTALTYLGEGDLPAVQLTFQELEQKSLAIAAYLQTKLTDQSPVIVALPSYIDFMPTLFGCFYAGMIAIPFYPPDLNQLDASIEKISKVAQSAEAKYVICPADFLEVAQDKDPSLSFLAPGILSAKNATLRPLPEADGRLALLMYTSGSTGNPKGVMIGEHNLISEMINFKNHCQCNDQDIMCIWLPNGHIAGLYMRFLGVMLGIQNVIFSPSQFLQKPELWLQTISRYRATLTAAPNFAYDLCAKIVDENSLTGVDLSCLRMAISGGERIRSETLDAFNGRFERYGFNPQCFSPYYGSTETLCTSICSQTKEPTRKTFSASQLKKGIVSEQKDRSDQTIYVGNGRPWSSTEIIIVNPNTKRCCPSNQVGEIWIRSTGNTLGYWRQPELTQKICQAYTADSKQGPFFRSGDLGFFKDDELYVTSRLKELIIIHGKNYYPEDIEATLKKQFIRDNVEACAAFAVNRSEEEQLIILVELAQMPDDQTASALMVVMKTAIAQQHGVKVSDLIFLEPQSMPRTVTRKIQRSVCSQKYIDGEWGQQLEQSTREPNFNSKHLSQLQGDSRITYVTSYLKSKFASVLAMPESHVDINKPIQCLGVNSIAIVKLISQLREQSQQTVSYDIFFNGTTIFQLACDIAKGGDTKSIETQYFRLVYQKDLDKLSDYIPQTLPPRTTLMGSAFLTGGTGFLGSYLIRDLLNTIAGNLYCLVRANNEAEGLLRLQKNMAQGVGWKAEDANRIKPIIGDFSKPNLGLSNRMFEHLSDAVDVIYHNGASVNFVAPYENLKQTNVLSLYEIFKLATQTKLKPIHFVSTIAVYLSPDRYQQSLPIKEDSLLPEPHRIFGGYAQSKWVSEMLCRKAIQRGLPIHIYRPGIITGDAQNGYVNVDDFLCRFLKGCMQMRAFPDINIEIDMSPVNYVSQAIVYLSQQNSNRQHSHYHLINSQPTTLKCWMSWLKNNGFQFDIIPFDNWLQRVKSDLAENNDLYPILPFVVDSVPNTSLTLLEIFKDNILGLDTFNSQKDLANSGIVCPTIDNSLFSCYVNYFEQSGFFEPLRSAEHPATIVN